MELNKAILDCMRELRRRLREEQALDIQYQQSDAIERMLRACADSLCAETRQMGERLSEVSGVQLPRLVQEPSFLPMQGSADQQYSGPLRGGARPTR
ncbi:hypothetical protein [Pseudomonas nitroreducens]|uniref:hypothetical protein n=1 Tax=Pseudomonas nitroreducens TaxID=46680 RepID=UPI0028929F49|nr:hypothetical protein [Pseudomonas nitritireducens]